jgi:hypothetical protein
VSTAPPNKGLVSPFAPSWKPSPQVFKDLNMPVPPPPPPSPSMFVLVPYH